MSLRWQSIHWQNTQEYPACLSISIAYLNLFNPLPALIEYLYFLPFRDIASFRFSVLWKTKTILSNTISPDSLDAQGVKKKIGSRLTDEHSK